jgi:hypothetical protein
MSLSGKRARREPPPAVRMPAQRARTGARRIEQHDVARTERRRSAVCDDEPERKCDTVWCWTMQPPHVLLHSPHPYE